MVTHVVKRFWVVVAALALAAAAACGGGNGAQREFGRPDAETIRKGSSEFVAAYNNKEIDKVLGSYTENAVLMPPNRPLLRGRDTLRTFYDEQFRRDGRLQMDVEEVVGHGPLAYQAGTYSITYGNTRDRGKYLFVLRNQNGAWRTEYAIWSSDLPEPTTAPSR